MNFMETRSSSKRIRADSTSRNQRTLRMQPLKEKAKRARLEEKEKVRRKAVDIRLDLQVSVSETDGRGWKR